MSGAAAGAVLTGTDDKPMIRHLSKDEVNEKYKSGLEDIDSTIENYKMSLTKKGIPECKWLRDTLARYKAKMIEQLGYDLDVASGHIKESTNKPAYSSPEDFIDFNRLAYEFRSYCLSGTNPNYNSVKEYKLNCQRCVPACEARRRGQEVIAKPSTYENLYLNYHPYDVWENADIVSTTGNGLDTISEKMSEWGDGARAQVVVYWDIPLGGGHTFLAEQINGKTVFTDPQNGDEEVTKYFNRVKTGRTTFCRIDNLDFSPYSEECF